MPDHTYFANLIWQIAESRLPSDIRQTLSGESGPAFPADGEISPGKGEPWPRTATPKPLDSPADRRATSRLARRRAGVAGAWASSGGGNQDMTTNRHAQAAFETVIEAHLAAKEAAC
jgi:hypothetical protein